MFKIRYNELGGNMKKFLTSLCLILIISSICLVGWACKEEVTETITDIVKGFDEVCLVTYLDEENNTVCVNSQYSFTIEEKNITGEEFETLTCEEMVFTNLVNMTFNKTLDYQINKEYKSLIVDSSGEKTYKLWKIVGIQEIFVQAKINDHNFLEIIDSKGEHFMVNTSYFEIVYFKN